MPSQKAGMDRSMVSAVAMAVMVEVSGIMADGERGRYQVLDQTWSSARARMDNTVSARSAFHNIEEMPYCGIWTSKPVVL
jgi:hypothetical protein